MATVIIIDDSEDILNVMRLMLSAAGFDVTGVANNGLEGVEMYKDSKPDIVLLDVQMPVMSGRKALRAIMKEDKNAFVIMLTGSSNVEVVDDCLEAGARHYIMKNDAQKVAGMVKELWDEHCG